jgi:hypothetical protein
MAKSLQPMPKSEMRSFADEIAGKNKVALDRFFSSHVDA